jgi:hypothetical protein
MFEPIYISVHTLQHSMAGSLGALDAFESSVEAFDSGSEFHMHPKGDLIVFRKDNGLYIMSHEEPLATRVTFKKFDLPAVDDLLLLIAMASVSSDLLRGSSLETEAADGDS